MLYYCLHALHKSPGNFTKCQVRLPHWSQTHTRISLSIQEATLDLSLTTISSCLLGVIIQHFYTPALPSETFQPTRKRKTTPGPSHLHTDWGKYICTKPNTLLSVTLDGHRKHSTLQKRSANEAQTDGIPPTPASP